MVTDKLRSYGAAKAEMGSSARHEQGLRVNRRRKVTPDWSAPLGVDRLGSRN